MCHVSEVRSGGARLDAFAGKSEGFHVATLIEISAGAYPESTLNPSPRLFEDIRYGDCTVGITDFKEQKRFAVSG